jgi:hypothetical protein
MNFDYWLAAIGPDAYMAPDAYLDEWQHLVRNHSQSHIRPTHRANPPA